MSARRYGWPMWSARVRTQVWIANVPESMTPTAVKRHLEMNGYGRARNVVLSRDTGLWIGGTQYGVVTFRSEASATIFREAGEHRRALFWQDGRRAVIIPATGRGVIPGGGHQKAGGYAGQKASRRQFCG